MPYACAYESLGNFSRGFSFTHQCIAVWGLWGVLWVDVNWAIPDSLFPYRNMSHRSCYTVSARVKFEHIPSTRFEFFPPGRTYYMFYLTRTVHLSWHNAFCRILFLYPLLNQFLVGIFNFRNHPSNLILTPQGNRGRLEHPPFCKPWWICRLLRIHSPFRNQVISVHWYERVSALRSSQIIYMSFLLIRLLAMYYGWPN